MSRHSRHLIGMTKEELRDVLRACEGELFYHELHQEKVEVRRYKARCELLEQRLDNIAAEERFRARERHRQRRAAA